MKKRVIDWIAGNLLTLILSFPTIVGFVFSVVAYCQESLSLLEIILIAALLCTFIVIIVRTIWYKYSYKAYHYPRKFLSTSCNYEVLEKTISYSRSENDTLNYSRTMKIKCLSNRLVSISDKYIWTGPSESTFSIIKCEGVSRIKKEPRIGIWQYFEIELQNHLKKNDERNISYKWPVITDCSLSSPFFSVSTDEPTKKLNLKLDLGKKYAEQRIMCEEFRAIESDFCISRIEEKLDENGTFNWVIPKVKRFRHYRIRWSWEVGKPAAEIDERN